MLSILMTVFAALALALAAIGLYGVASFSVAQRTHEVGVRMAPGASDGEVVRMVLRQGLVLAGLGLVLGLGGAVAVSRVLTSLLVGVTPHDPQVFTVVPVVLAAVSVAAC